jgi:hypothetical protein
MPQFESLVRLSEIEENDAGAARRAIEERLRTAGFHRWHIVNLSPQGTPNHYRPRPPRRPTRVDRAYAGGGMLVAAVVAWTLWFLWLLAG